MIEMPCALMMITKSSYTYLSHGDDGKVDTPLWQLDGLEDHCSVPNNQEPLETLTTEVGRGRWWV